MTGGGDGKDLAAIGLDEIAKGLTLALGELKELGMVGEAGTGRGFGDIALSGLELGAAGLTSAFDSFCERWEWGVRSLINEGNGFALKTGLAAGTYYEVDQYVEGAMKIGVNSVMGNPYASEEEVTGKDWGQVLSSNAFTHVRDADYSKESFDRAWENSAQGWKDAGRDVMTSENLGLPGVGPESVRERLGISQAQYERMLDEQFGPSPEARAAAAEQQGGER
ncbi:hypothetical protein [Streptomyces prasinopilosus]|uniref:Uncharacterized protein n=1 Tax=Streptomyces prasinopilosus TaxID=67344 RepID=A0A1G6P7B5_9ACTN|nr:hypothetical protein [Streptomyces prasinopilosus]SDC75979.1 hypothetical protein SAMN05216505_103452 [Streptomyces prasinopilosus]